MLSNFSDYLVLSAMGVTLFGLVALNVWKDRTRLTNDSPAAKLDEQPKTVTHSLREQEPVNENPDRR